jgi:hypothetical protein
MKKKNKSKRKSSSELMASAARCSRAHGKVQFPPSNVPPGKRISGGVEGGLTMSDDVVPALARTAVRRVHCDGGSVEESSSEEMARGRRRSGAKRV